MGSFDSQGRRIRAMLTYEMLKTKLKDFLSATGMTIAEFERLLPTFSEAYQTRYCSDRAVLVWNLLGWLFGTYKQNLIISFMDGFSWQDFIWDRFAK